MRRIVVLLTVWILGLTVAAGCGGHDDSGRSSAKAKLPDGSIVIGMAVARSGFAAAYDLVSGFDTAQEEAAAAMARLLDQLEERRAAGSDS